MRRVLRIAGPCATLAASAALLAACGSGSRPATTGRAAATGNALATSTPTSGAQPSALSPGGSCTAIVARTLGTVAQRIYTAAQHGNVVGQAVHRVESSATLAEAVSANDAPAARAALRSLLAGQIVGVRVLKDGKVFAAAGSTTAIAPVRGVIGTTGAQFVLSTQAARSYLQVARQVTGADVVLLARSGAGGAKSVGSTLPSGALPARLPASGRVKVGGRTLEVDSLAGALYPAGALRIMLLVPPASGASCAGSPQQRAVTTLGRVGERIYREEAGSAYVRATLRRIESDAGFQRAVAARDVPAIRAAIVRLFAAHIHVVRVRVYAVEPSGAQRFVYDLGGPYVLAPVHGTVRSGGRIVGRFSYAIQDDAGYLRLAQLFTGAEVLMRVGGRQVIGTLDPGPAHVPDRGTVVYHGTRYAVYSFTGEAFPSGALEISLLVPIDGR